MKWHCLAFYRHLWPATFLSPWWPLWPSPHAYSRSVWRISSEPMCTFCWNPYSSETPAGGTLWAWRYHALNGGSLPWTDSGCRFPCCTAGSRSRLGSCEAHTQTSAREWSKEFLSVTSPVKKGWRPHHEGIEAAFKLARSSRTSYLKGESLCLKLDYYQYPHRKVLITNESVFGYDRVAAILGCWFRHHWSFSQEGPLVTMLFYRQFLHQTLNRGCSL